MDDASDILVQSEEDNPFIPDASGGYYDAALKNAYHPGQ